MNRLCKKCGEPWDVYHITHEEGLLDGYDSEDALEYIQEGGFELFLTAFSVQEAYEGHFAIMKCPACKSNGCADA